MQVNGRITLTKGATIASLYDAKERNNVVTGTRTTVTAVLSQYHVNCLDSCNIHYWPFSCVEIRVIAVCTGNWHSCIYLPYFGSQDVYECQLWTTEYKIYVNIRFCFYIVRRLKISYKVGLKVKPQTRFRFISGFPIHYYHYFYTLLNPFPMER
jgi:hypothetical protein